MIETIASVGMLVEEVLRIKKNHLMPDEPTGTEKRLCIVTGIYGGELGGQYICYEVIRRIKANYDKLTGIVDVYPSLNPMGLDSATRDIPLFDMDFNTVFPGSTKGTVTEYTAACIVEDIKTADVCVDIHSSNMFVREVPQVRINDDNIEELSPYAMLLNTDVVWVHPSTSVENGSLAYALNEEGVKTMVIEEGVANSIDYANCNQIVDGIFSLMSYMGIWSDETCNTITPLFTDDEDVEFINTESSGIFIPTVSYKSRVKEGDELGRIVDVITGSIEETVTSPIDGYVYTIREYPAVEEGSLVARVFGGRDE